MYEVIHTSPANRDIAIDGELICESSSSIVLTEDDERTFHVRAFATKRGFAVVIEMNSSNATIADVVEAEIVDTAADVELVLSVFEPLEYVNQQTFLSGWDGAKSRLSRNLVETYYKTLDEVVTAVDHYETIRPCSEPEPVAQESKPANRILKFFGLS